MLKRKKSKREAPSSQQKRSPIIGYYRPSNRGNRIENESSKPSSLRNFATTINTILRTLIRNVFLIAIAIIILFNTTISGASVKILDEKADSYRSLDTYNFGIEVLLNSSLLNKSKLTFRSLDFEDKLRVMFPEVRDVSVVVPLAGRKLQVGVNFDQPFFRLRTDDNQSQGIVGESGRLIILEQTNIILERFPSTPSLSLDPFVNFTEGDQVLTGVEVELLRLVMSEFNGSEKFRPLPESVLFKVEKREMEVRFEGVDYYAKLTPEREARPQIGSLVATLERLTEEGSTPKSYIDVRVDDRVFVK